MEIEIRVKSYVLFNMLLESECKRISFGSEGCYYLLPSEPKLREMVVAAKRKNKIFKLITPKVTEAAYTAVLSLIKVLDEYDNTEVTINDWGILNQVKLKKAKIYIGHMLNWTMEACPWHENIMRDEMETIKHLGEVSNFDNQYKIEILRKYNVLGIETDYHESAKESFVNMEKNGIEIFTHYNLVSLSFSRTCPTAKYHNLTFPACVDLCRDEEKIDISLSKIWDSNETGQHYLETDEDVKNLCRFKIDGNWIYRDVEKGSWDKVIYHVRNFSDLENCKEIMREEK